MPRGNQSVLANNLAVVCGHFQEGLNSHAALIAFFSLVDRDDAFGCFLLADDYLVRNLLEFALTELVAKLLTPSASAAAPRSSPSSEDR